MFIGLELPPQNGMEGTLNEKRGNPNEEQKSESQLISRERPKTWRHDGKCPGTGELDKSARDKDIPDFLVIQTMVARELDMPDVSKHRELDDLVEPSQATKICGG